MHTLACEDRGGHALVIQSKDLDFPPGASQWSSSCNSAYVHKVYY